MLIFYHRKNFNFVLNISSNIQEDIIWQNQIKKLPKTQQTTPIQNSSNKKTLQKIRIKKKNCPNQYRIYSITQILRRYSSLYHPISNQEIKDLLELRRLESSPYFPLPSDSNIDSNLNKKLTLKNPELPQTVRIPSELPLYDDLQERLDPLNKIAPDIKADSIRTQVDRTLKEHGHFLRYANVDERNPPPDLLPFALCRVRNDASHTIPLLHFHSKDKQKKNTKSNLFTLCYNIPPHRLGISSPYEDDPKSQPVYRMTVDYMNQVSARWHFLLDLLYNSKYLSESDAANIRQVISDLLTLGEIPIHPSNFARDHSSINFSVLSSLTRDLHIAEKSRFIQEDTYRKNLPPSTISCLDIVLGAYDLDNSGSLILREKERISAYPVFTQFWNSMYYIALAVPTQDCTFDYRYLRIDHILSAEPSQKTMDYPPCTLKKLGTPPGIEEYFYGTTFSHYSISNCLQETLVNIIDAFGKNALSNCSHTDANEWNFNIRIPESREDYLNFLIGRQKELPIFIHKWSTEKQKNNSALPSPSQSISSMITSLMDMFGLDPDKYSYDPFAFLHVDEFPTNVQQIISALRNRDAHSLMSLLEERNGEKFTAEEAAWIFHFMMPLSTETFRVVLPFCPPLDSVADLFHGPNNIAYKIGPVALAAHYDRKDLMELLLEYGLSPNEERDEYLSPLYAAIKRGSLNCLTFLLEHPDIDTKLTDDLLSVLAGSGEKIDPAKEIAAPVLLGCEFKNGRYHPFPESFRLEEHIAHHKNLPALIQFCECHGPNLNDEQIQTILDYFFYYPMASDSPEGIICFISDLYRYVPGILRTTKAKYMLAVAVLSSDELTEPMKHLLRHVVGPHIVLPDYQYHNWFGRKGMIHRWDKLNDPSIGRKDKLLPAINRHSAPPCDPKAMSTEIMDLILKQFKIVGKAKDKDLSVLSHYALQYASPEMLRRHTEMEDGLLATEDPHALQAYVRQLKETRQMDSSRQDLLITVLEKY